MIIDPLNTFQKIGVQAQVFTVVNDESYYFPDLIRGMIVDGAKGADIAKRASARPPLLKAYE